MIFASWAPRGVSDPAGCCQSGHGAEAQWASCDAGGIGVRTPWRLTITTFVRTSSPCVDDDPNVNAGHVDICATAIGAAIADHSATATTATRARALIGRT